MLTFLTSKRVRGILVALCITQCQGRAAQLAREHSPRDNTYPWPHTNWPYTTRTKSPNPPAWPHTHPTPMSQLLKVKSSDDVMGDDSGSHRDFIPHKAETHAEHGGRGLQIKILQNYISRPGQLYTHRHSLLMSHPKSCSFHELLCQKNVDHYQSY